MHPCGSVKTQRTLVVLVQVVAAGGAGWRSVGDGGDEDGDGVRMMMVEVACRGDGGVVWQLWWVAGGWPEAAGDGRNLAGKLKE
ncbi:hypothetical protein Tco_0074854 [Tanacetum coccineum]